MAQSEPTFVWMKDIQTDRSPITQADIDDLVQRIIDLYRQDATPWVVGLSGKDSTGVVQLIFRALMKLEPEERHKKVWVLSSNTGVENPKIHQWILESHEELRQVARDYQLPVEVHEVNPSSEQSFWVHVVGKGIPAPTRSFRWCTERLKLDPIICFILEHIDSEGRVIQVLGTRSAESSRRKASIKKHTMENGNFSHIAGLEHARGWMPVKDWDNDHIWEYLTEFEKPWGGTNATLWGIYQSASGGECVLDLDQRANTCGGSRNGCWTCTVVQEDKSLTNMVGYDSPEFAPLLEYRNWLLEIRNDYQTRSVRGRNGRIRLNVYALREAAGTYAEGKSARPHHAPEAIRKAWEAGAKWREAAFNSQTDSSLAEAAAIYAKRRANQLAMKEPDEGQQLYIDQLDTDGLEEFYREELLAAFTGGNDWATSVLADPEGNRQSIVPGPHLMAVRYDLLRRLFNLEHDVQRYLPGWRTVTDEDLHWIRHWWENDGGNPDMVDRLRNGVHRPSI